jgi:HTH-type transcriptional regulator / antitoxin HigA
MKTIKTDFDHETALARIYELMHQSLDTDSPERDELEILIILVEQYEAQICLIAPPNPIEAIKFRMEQLGMKNADLAEYLGHSSRVSEILSGKRRLSVQMMKNLYHKMGVPAASLLAE